MRISLLRNLFLACLLAALTACVAGRDFQRPTSQDLVLGKTTYAEVSQRFGPAYRTSVMRINDTDLDAVIYSYSESGGSPLVVGVTPARAMTFYFHKGVLVGHKFASSFASDASDFADDQVGKIEKGKTTRAQVIALLGSPSGEYAPPMVKDNGDRAIGYNYSQMKMQGMSPSIHGKELTVTLDGAGIVTDVNFLSSGVR